MSNKSKPQVADAFGQGTHDAEPGELEGIASSYLHDARAYLLAASNALKDAGYSNLSESVEKVCLSVGEMKQDTDRL